MAGKADKPEPKPESAEDRAVKAFLAALRDWDEKGAAKALKLAISACIEAYETKEEDEDEVALVASASPDEDD